MLNGPQVQNRSTKEAILLKVIFVSALKLRSAFQWEALYLFTCKTLLSPRRTSVIVLSALPSQTCSLIPLKCPRFLHPKTALCLTYLVIELQPRISPSNPPFCPSDLNRHRYLKSSEREFIIQRLMCGLCDQSCSLTLIHWE